MLVGETDLTIDYIHAIADTVYRPGDVAGAIPSGSFRAQGMIIAPCSIKTVSGIAISCSDKLLLRAADVALKERRQLVAELGAIVMPPVPASCHRPQS